MVCESWRAKLDNYLDGELSSEEMRAFGTHVQSCRFCATDALVSVQLKRSIQAAGKRFTPSAEFRRRVQQSIAAKPRRGIARFSWMIATEPRNASSRFRSNALLRSEEHTSELQSRQYLVCRLL